jgi:transcription elongation GreA/GreB family factor
VSGTSRVTFSLDGRRPETRMLYHWSYPEADRSRLQVGTFLGAILIGMTVGQRMPLLAGGGVEKELQVLRIHTSGLARGLSFD